MKLYLGKISLIPYCQKSHLGNYRNQFGQGDYDQSFESRLKAGTDGAG